MLADDRGWCYDLVVQVQIERGDVMRKFWRRKKAAEAGTASTFVEATGGGWGDLPDSVPSDGGEQFDYVGQVLEQARAYAQQSKVPVGEEFQFTMTDIPVGIASPINIVFGIMMRAGGLGGFAPRSCAPGHCCRQNSLRW